jgi:hypothetical protein
VPEFFLLAVASPDSWPEKGRHIGGQKAEFFCRFVGCVSSAIVYFECEKTYLPKVLELACLREGDPRCRRCAKEEVGICAACQHRPRWSRDPIREQ